MSRRIHLKNIFLFLFFFFLFFIWNLIFVPLNLDEVWNYGFSHSIYQGLIPYKDFNMILTPFYPFIMSLPFHIFGSSMLVFHVFNAILLSILSLLLFYLVKEKAWFLILFFFFPLPFSFPSYNLFLYFLFVIILILERRKSNDYLIGIILGITLLTKQSVGVCLLLVSFYYIKDLKKIGKRFVGFIIPVFIFILYLVFTRSVLEFLDLCFFGLFDFASSNGTGFNLYFVLFIIMIVVIVGLIIKNKKNIYHYYALAFSSVMIPLFDTYHFQVAFIGLLTVIFMMQNIKIPIKPILFSLGVIIGVVVVTGVKRFDTEIIYPNDIRHFEYRMLDKDSIEFTKEVNQYMEEHKDKKFFFLGSNGYYFRIVNDMDISYIDLINRGNWGYDGSNKLLKEIKSRKDYIYFVDESELSPIKQTDKKALRYVMKYGKKIGEIRIFDIYVFDKK